MRDENEIPDRQWVIATVVVAVLLGAAWLAQSIELVFGGPAVAGGIYPTIPMLVLALSGLLGRWIRRTERLLVYCTLLVGLPLTASGLMHRFLPGLVTGFYGGFANPNSRYASFFEKMPRWIAP